jgi:hypothetical protein
MGQELDGNGRALAVLGSKMDSVGELIERMCREWAVDHDKIAVHTVQIGNLETRPPVVCPKHDELAREVRQLQLDFARASVTSGASGGIIVSVVAGVVIGVGKAAGWW